ncbi:thioredoxin family protein [Limnoraphis robusta]|uniref:Thioredoxin domain-containing protein n=1 Tax=Limnoraphis robusta CCNP1315 TaxID=3110306 RepID=A0ABU5U594_9CYAN|nr:thioredoxin domain-containing protein [Limnoraphis robusta]MEA5522250.1 thioredoxin domain-containing protein [Limnoraphis robusta CCNP1315]MEA5545781.1 thioredoxin domain-containing protein [Limnoraphis robusta CCNP1324]
MLLSIREQNFAKEVLGASVPVLVHFWAPWCGLCRLIVPQLHQFQANWQDQVKVVGVNADQSLKLASTYRLQTLPTVILFDNGRELNRLEQFHGREDLRRTLDEFMQNYQNRSRSLSLSTPEYLTLEA